MEAKYISGAQLAALRANMSDDEWLCVWLMLETGLRVGDAVALRASAVRKDGIHYTAQKTRKKGVAPISDALRGALRSRGNGYIFPSPMKPGEHITRQAVWARIKRAAKRAGLELEGVSPHAARKVFAVETFREKGMEATRKALQHAGRDTTEIYAFADFCTGDNAAKPLLRADLRMIVGMVVKALSADKSSGL